MQKEAKRKNITVRMVRNRMMIVYTLLLLTVFFACTAAAVKVSKDDLINELSDEIISIDTRYASAAEDFALYSEIDCTRAFMSGAHEYDPLSIAEHEKSEQFNNARSVLLQASAGRHYNDFLIMYTDNSSVGNVSSGASERLGTEGYSYFENKLGENADVWFFDPDKTSGKLCYLRRFSETSIFMLSFYADELDSVLSGPDSESFLLADPSGIIIASNLPSVSPGTALPEEISSMFEDKSGECCVSGSRIGVSMETDNGWQAVTLKDIPKAFYLDTKNNGRLLAISAALLLVSLSAGILSCAGFSAALLAKPDNEFIDHETGVLNEYGLDEKVSEELETMIVGSTCAVIVVSINDAENIRRTMPPRKWNELRMKIISSAEDYFVSNKRFHIGRFNDDRIAMFADYSEFDIFKAHEKLKSGCEGLCSIFKGFTLDEAGDMLLSISIGACIYPDHAEDFDALIAKASAARKRAEKRGGCAYCMYDPKEDNA